MPKIVLLVERFWKSFLNQSCFRSATDYKGIRETDMEQNIIDTIDLVEHAANLLKNTFVGKDDLVDLLATCAIAQEHLLIVGPPGTAKSDLIKRFAMLCNSNGDASDETRISYFEYLLTRFTEPNEIFGAIDIAAFRQGHEGKVKRDTRGMLPRAEITFLDEVFKSNSAILNALLTILNERIFYNAGEKETVPNIFTIGATNSVPDDLELAALYDRFLLRVWTDNVEETRFPELFRRGWHLEKERMTEGYELNIANILTTANLRELHQAAGRIDLSPISGPYREVIRRIRAEGIRLSDRRVVKLLKLVAVSALRQKRDAAHAGDFWVLRHVWNDPEQIPHLQTIVDPYVQAFEGEQWRAERPLKDIAADLEMLAARRDKLSHDTDYVDYLQQLEGLRKELLRHSSATGKAPDDDQHKNGALRQQIVDMIEALIQILDANV